MHWFLRLFLLVTLALPVAAQTQLDPNFLAQRLYSPTSYLQQVLQLADGSRLLVGYIERANGTTVSHSLVKFLPSGQLDATFNTQVAQYQFTATAVAEAPGNKLIVGLIGPGIFGAQTHNGVVRLLANGSLDTSFAPQPAPLAYDFGRIYLVQADGKIVVGNEVARALNSTGRTLARLNVDGTPDTSFGNLLPNNFSDPTGRLYSPIKAICQQADGKLLISHNAPGATQGSYVPKLTRLLLSGATDASFFYSTSASIIAMALQPDGKILIATSDFRTSSLLTRLQPSGAIDFSFQSPNNLRATELNNNPSNIQVQPDGRILVASVAERTASQRNTRASSFVVRLLATGALDTSWQPPMYGDYQADARGIQLLPNGQVLVAGRAKLYASTTALPAAVGLLEANGANVASFAPALENGGQVLSMALQPDGRIVAGGEFTEINGTPARNLARFYADGTLDVAFTANAAVLGGYVRDIKLQADGKMVVSGQFISAGGQARAAVARLLPSGLCDPTFVTGLVPNNAFNVQTADYIAIQPDGQVLATGALLPTGATPAADPLALVRLTAAGPLDASFQPQAFLETRYLFPLLVQPDGKIITAGLTYPGSSGAVMYELVTRLLPDGSLDPTFTRIPTGRNGTDSPVQIWHLNRYPDGRLLVGGNFVNYGPTVGNNLVRLLPTGALDATFTSPIASFIAETTAIQPNGRVLAAGINYGGGSNPPILRLLADGTFDTSFSRAQGPVYGSWVRKLLVQPDGGLLVAGSFSTVAGQPREGLIRLLDANVLHVSSQRLAARTEVWPVPAHGTLHLSLDAAAQPQQVRLLDGLGRVVLTQAVTQAKPVLDIAALPVGLYLLHVDYAAGGTVTRRIVVE